MARRLNDTQALVERPVPPINEHHSLVCRKIDNGFLVTDVGPKSCSETFYREPPRIIPARVARSKDTTDSGGLADTMGYLGEERLGR